MVYLACMSNCNKTYDVQAMHTLVQQNTVHLNKVQLQKHVSKQDVLYVPRRRKDPGTYNGEMPGITPKWHTDKK